MDSTLAGAHYDLGLLFLFSPNDPGRHGPGRPGREGDQELETYRTMRNRRRRGPGDDMDDLIAPPSEAGRAADERRAARGVGTGRAAGGRIGSSR